MVGPAALSNLKPIVIHGQHSRGAAPQWTTSRPMWCIIDGDWHTIFSWDEVFVFLVPQILGPVSPRSCLIHRLRQVRHWISLPGIYHGGATSRHVGKDPRAQRHSTDDTAPVIAEETSSPVGRAWSFLDAIYMSGLGIPRVGLLEGATTVCRDLHLNSPSGLVTDHDLDVQPHRLPSDSWRHKGGRMRSPP